MAYYDKSTTGGFKVMSYEGTADVMSYYPNTVKDWISRHGGLTTDMKKVQERARALGHRRSLPGRDFLIRARDYCCSMILSENR